MKVPSLKLLLLLLLLFLPLSAAASEKSRVMLILDSSGSMWGQIAGKAKITIAREALTGIIDTIPADFETGLITYGHRRKGDCRDIELIVPPGPHDAAAMKERLGTINAKGKTPLSAAVQLAAQTLRYSEEAGSVILLTDGLETCDSDPCRVAAELAESGVDFTVHVIGFDLSQGDLGRLRCLADKTGGLFLAADNAEALQSALTATVKKVGEPPPLLVENPGSAELKAPRQVTVGQTFEVNWQGPDSRNDHVCLAPLNRQDDQCLDFSYTKQGNPVKLTADCDAGNYELRYIHSHSQTVIGRTEITVVPVQADLQVPAEVDAASRIEVAWQGPGYPTDYIAVAVSSEQDQSYIYYTYTSEGSPLLVQAPAKPGNYEVRYILGGGDRILARKNLMVKPVSASIEVPSTAAAAGSFAVQWQGPNSDGDSISIARSEDDGGGYIAYAYTHSGNPVVLTAPSAPGVYEIRYVLGLDDVILARRPIEITAVEAQVDPPESADIAVSFAVEWQGPNNSGDYISIARPEAEGGEYVDYAYTDSADSGKPLKLTAPSVPGIYEIRYVLGQDDVVLARRPMEIKAVGAQVQAPSSAPMGSVIEVSWQGPGSDGDYIAVAAPDQDAGSYVHYEYTAADNPVRLQLPSVPGRYEVRYVLGLDDKLLAKQAIEITSVKAGVQGPASAAAGSEIDVSWQGPNNESDYISIAGSGDEGGHYLAYQYTAAGNPVRITVPEEAGDYEIRYVLGEGDTVMATAGLKIE
jgi:Ca-activated chloride channel family protein